MSKDKMLKVIIAVFLSLSMFTPTISLAGAPRCETIFATNFFREQRESNDSLLGKLLFKALKIQRLEEIYDRYKSLPPENQEYWGQIIKHLDIKVHYSQEQLDKIPKTGPVVFVSNHPFGAIDGLTAMALIRQVRPDVKVMMTDAFGKMIPEIMPEIVNVNLSGSPEGKAYNQKQVAMVNEWVKDGHAMMIFPAGEISRSKFPGAQAFDAWWKPTAARLARENGAQIVPFHFEGQNSKFFQGISLLTDKAHKNKWPSRAGKGTTVVEKIKGGVRQGLDMIRQLAIVANIINKIGKDLVVHIGDPMGKKLIEKFSSDQALADFMQMTSYSLAENPKLALSQDLLENGDFIYGTRLNKDQKKLQAERERKMEPIAVATDKNLLISEVESLRRQDPRAELYHPEKSPEAGEQFSVFIAKREQIPNVVREIGRLREITFRAVDEGTGKALDLDKYDDSYHHLFVWDNQNQEVVASYRIGFVQELLQKEGLSGVYTSTLFNYNKDFLIKLGPSLELGRSFVRPEYQGGPAIDLLFQGIMVTGLRNPQIKTMFGPVSMSNSYSTISKMLTVEYMKKHLMAEDALVSMVQAPHALNSENPMVSVDKMKNLLSQLNSMAEVSRAVENIEGQQLPPLMKLYPSWGAKFLNFSVDKSFNSLDGLVMLDTANMSERLLLKRYMGQAIGHDYKAAQQQFVRDMQYER